MISVCCQSRRVRRYLNPLFYQEAASTMDISNFNSLLADYGIPLDDTYEDLSEVGTPIWHNDDLSINIVCKADSHPCLSLVVFTSKGDYVYFESPLAKFTSSEVSGFVAYVRENLESIRRTVLSAISSISVPVSGREFVLTKV